MCHYSSSIDHTRLANVANLDIISSISSLPNLNEFDPDLNIPTNINSKHYTPHEFHSSTDLCNLSDKSISFLHGNIRSLSANVENFQRMLNTLNHSFKIIGLSETWISFNKDTIANLFLPGFDFISQPIKFSIGGVGFYIAYTLRYTIRDDLNSSSDQEESLWI